MLGIEQSELPEPLNPPVSKTIISGVATGEFMKAFFLLAAMIFTSGGVADAQVPIPLTPEGQALIEAAFHGNLEKVQDLLSEGVPADVTTPEKQTPLMWAAFNGHTPVVSLLLEKGASLDKQEENSRTALMYASSGSFPETVELLLEKGATVNVQGSLEGFTALMTAAAEGHHEVVRLLLVYGADPAIRDKDGDTAESFASQNGHSDVVLLLRNPPAASSAAE
jgi:ankyrin repeat protein